MNKMFFQHIKKKIAFKWQNLIFTTGGSVLILFSTKHEGIHLCRPQFFVTIKINFLKHRTPRTSKSSWKTSNSQQAVTTSCVCIVSVFVWSYSFCSISGCTSDSLRPWQDAYLFRIMLQPFTESAKCIYFCNQTVWEAKKLLQEFHNKGEDYTGFNIIVLKQ